MSKVLQLISTFQDRPMLKVADRRYGFCDFVTWGFQSGVFNQRLCSYFRTSNSSVELDSLIVNAEASYFRERVGLMTVDATETWLGRAELDLNDWTCFLAWQGGNAELFEFEDWLLQMSEPEYFLWLILQFSGQMKDLLSLFAVRIHSFSKQQTLPNKLDWSTIEASFSSRAKNEISSAMTRRFERVFRQDWIWLELELTKVSSSDLAREIFLSASLDGQSLQNLAKESQSFFRNVKGFLKNFDPHLRGIILSGQNNSWLPPVEVYHGLWITGQVLEKLPADENSIIDHQFIAKVVLEDSLIHSLSPVFQPLWGADGL
ncbi:MAG: hypothetical protein MK193_11950 [Lentisphaeria bacterium]|nr:hypothetical protein [Lentisphaeria bacterium]